MKKLKFCKVVFAIPILTMFLAIPVNATKLPSGKQLSEDSVMFTDDGGALEDGDILEEDFVISKLDAMLGTSQQELLQTRQSVPLKDRQAMCAEDIIKQATNYKADNSLGVNVLKYALSKDEIREVFTVIKKSHPEFFYLTNRYGMTLYSTDMTSYPDWDCDKLVQDFYPYFTWNTGLPYEADVKAIDTAWEEVNYATNEYMKNLSLASADDAGKMLLIHDYMVGLCNYNYDAYNAYLENGTVLDKYIHAYDMYGALVEQSPVCSGYQLAYRWVLNQAGITDVTYAYQDNHIWNVVKLNDKWYHVDLTLDDLEPYGSAYHKNFLESDTAIQATHGDFTCDVTCNDTTYDSYYWDTISTIFYFNGKDYLYVNNSADMKLCRIGSGFVTSNVLQKGTQSNEGNSFWYNTGDYYFTYDMLTEQCEYVNPYPTNLDGRGLYGFPDRGIMQYHNHEDGEKWMLVNFEDKRWLKEGYTKYLNPLIGIILYDGKFYVSSLQSNLPNGMPQDEYWQVYDHEIVNNVIEPEGMFRCPLRTAERVTDANNPDMDKVELYVGEVNVIPIKTSPACADDLLDWTWAWQSLPHGGSGETYLPKYDELIQITKDENNLYIKVDESLLNERCWLAQEKTWFGELTIGPDNEYNGFDEKEPYQRFFDTYFKVYLKKRPPQVQPEPTNPDTGSTEDSGSGGSGDTTTDPGLGNQTPPDSSNLEVTSQQKKIGKASIKSVKYSKSKKKLTIKMKKADKRYKYQCQISKNSKFKKIYKKKTFKSKTLTVKKLKKGKYYIRVRLTDGKQYGAWSKTKKVTVK